VVVLADLPALRKVQCVTRAELAKLLGVSVGWVRQNEHEFPSTWSAGSEPRYLLSDVERLIERRRRVFPAVTAERLAA
jgi:transcriptional regulator with XRE-family HTH domain